MRLLECRKSNRVKRQSAGSYWALIGVGEPFRLLFPLGVLIGCIGVGWWPCFIWSGSGIYPGQFHARIMIEGFLTCFVIGFLGTALPRMLEIPVVGRKTTIAIGLALIGVTFLHLNTAIVWGDRLFVVTLFLFLGRILIHAFLSAKDLPPPSFVLVLMGLLSALFGVAIPDFCISLNFKSIPAWALPLAKLLIYQGYILFPVLGVGAFLMPRFLNLPNRQSFPESLKPSAEWIRRFRFSLFCGLALLTGFVLEACGWSRTGHLLRGLTLIAFFRVEVPMRLWREKSGTLGTGLRISIGSITAAYLFMAILPTRAFSLLHLLFLSGFSLLTLIIASRVILGHSGQAALFCQKIRSIRWIISLVLVAMVTRVTADWMPEHQMSHYAYAAVVWLAAMAIWIFSILPGVTRVDADS